MKRLGVVVLLLCCAVLVSWAQQGPSDGMKIQHVVMLGDSNTFIGGDDCDKPQGWNKWFRELVNPLTCRSYARSGATWTETSKTVYDIEEYTEVLSDNNVISNQVNRLVMEACVMKTQPVPDLILIMAGTNDLWFADKRPEPLSKYVRKNCTMLADSFPQARIVLITPPPFTKVPMDVQHQAADAIAQCGQSMGLTVIRLDKAQQLLPPYRLVRRGYLKDGVHTTAKGAKVLGSYIYDRLKIKN